MKWPGLIRHYRSRLPVTDATPVVTLLEGSTPLIPAPRFVGTIGGNFSLYLKFEGLNPTCSFKDRGMTMAVSKAKERGAELVVCASTGNTSAAASAYAASAGLKCGVILPHGNIALGKLAQAIMYGAAIVPISGNFDDALRLVRELASRPEVEIVNSINPVRIEGQKTAAFEICDVLGRAPDFHFLPVGNAGNITAYWKGFSEYAADGVTSSTPKMCGYQAAGSAPIVLGAPVAKPDTIASAIRIGNPASWKSAVAAYQDSGGWIDSVTDEEILEAYRLVARLEGVFVEPASAASLAGLIKANAAGKIPEGSVVTATLTGHGLKDPDMALKQAPTFLPVEPTLDCVLRSLAL